MSRPLRRLTLLGLLMAYSYGEARGHNYSVGGDHYLAYSCLRHFVPDVGGVMAGPRCPCGEALLGQLLVRVRCDCGSNLYYPANISLPAAVKHVRDGHRPKPIAEER
jgi:hypothetical protein